MPKSDIYIREYKTKIIKKMSEAKGSASDIVISGQKYDDQSQITQTTQNSFQVNPTRKKKKGFFSTKKRKIILFSLIGIVLIGVIIGVIVALNHKEKPKPNPNECTGDDCDNINKGGNNNGYTGGNGGKNNIIDDENPVIDIYYKKNDIYIYNETLSRTTTVEINGKNSLKGRRLEDSYSQKTKMTTQYLIIFMILKNQLNQKLYIMLLFFL